MTQNQDRKLESTTLSQSMVEKEGCSVGCFSVKSNNDPTGGTSSTGNCQANKSRHCETSANATNNWKCPDPGCKTINSHGKDCCGICHLPRHSTHQFKRGESKILKQL